jgi:hypothetical protein
MEESKQYQMTVEKLKQSEFFRLHDDGTTPFCLVHPHNRQYFQVCNNALLSFFGSAMDDHLHVYKHKSIQSLLLAA